MRFPGKRRSKHYFPVSDQGRIPFAQGLRDTEVYLVGIGQPLVDIEAHVSEDFLAEVDVPKGESVLLDDATVDRVYAQLKDHDQIVGEFAGGTVGNTLHNYAVLADDRAFLLGAITQQITVGDYAFHYVRNTSSRVSLANLHPVPGPMGRAVCFITPDGERSFGISRGIMDELPAAAIPEDLIAGAAALVVTTYLFRDEHTPIYESTCHAMDLARRHDVPVVLTLGTESLVRDKRELFVALVRDRVSVLAGNLEEVGALVDRDDPLLAGKAALAYADLCLLTDGCEGLYLAGYVDRSRARRTKDVLHSKSIPQYNLFEYSRAMRKRDCTDPMRIYSHINPYHGGARIIRNTNGAGDAALASLLHDMAANRHHQTVSPTSPKHAAPFLTYSSIHQICKYANRVSYEVLSRNAPRLVRGLPEREDSLEEAYWDA